MDVHVDTESGASGEELPTLRTLELLGLLMRVQSPMSVQCVALLERLPADVANEVPIYTVHVASVLVQAIMMLERLLADVALNRSLVVMGSIVGAEAFSIFERPVTEITNKLFI